MISLLQRSHIQLSPATHILMFFSLGSFGAAQSLVSGPAASTVSATALAFLNVGWSAGPGTERSGAIPVAPWRRRILGGVYFSVDEGGFCGPHLLIGVGGFHYLSTGVGNFSTPYLCIGAGSLSADDRHGYAEGHCKRQEVTHACWCLLLQA